jgi:hypothetical protein
MYWLFTDSTGNKDTNIFYQHFNNSTMIEFNDFICYNAQSTSIISKKNTKSIIYDIYIKGNLIKYVNKDEERTFIYETDRISSISNNLLVFKNSYKETDNCKLPLLVDSCYDNVYKNIEFKIFELPNNTLQIQSNNNFIFILSKTPSL